MNPKVIKTFLFAFLALGVLFVGIRVTKPMFEKHRDEMRYKFDLETVDGPIKLEDFKGKVVALYFGYMYCPDVCPTSLSSLSEALNSLTKKEQENFQGVFVSVDPKRDSLEHLKGYAAYFHKNFIGATIDDEQYLHELTERYGGYFRKVALEGSKMGYSVNHTSDIFLFDKNGNFSSKIPHMTKQEDIISALRMAEGR